MAVLLTLAAIAVAVLAVVLYRASRPEQRRPGESLDEVTDRLAREVSTDAPEPRFTDVTAAAGLGAFRTFQGTRSSQLPEDMGSGAAWGDYDNDGDEDLLLVAAGGSLEGDRTRWAPTLLYENRGDGTFRRDETFPELRISGMAAAWGDFDADGWLDLVVTGYGALELFHNQRGRLVPGPDLPAADDRYNAGAAWGDFDNDGDLDLYVCGYVQYVEAGSGERRTTRQYGQAQPFTLNPASYEPAANLLFENDGAGGFRDVALPWGVSNPGGRSLGALWHDFDQDGRLDLYVANDISDNALLMNRGDTFEDISLAAQVADYRGAMGMAPGDWDRDGDDDLFITHWVAQENALYDSRLADLAANGDGTGRLLFTDLSARLGLGAVALPMVGWGTELADLDSDGWLDLVVVNGSTIQDKDDPTRLQAQRPFLFWNRRGEHFDDLAPRNEALSRPHVGRGMALADYDQDGDLDMLVVHLGEGVELLRNDMDQGNWLELRLRTAAPSGGEMAEIAEVATNPGGGLAASYGEGSTVVVSAGGVELRRSVTGVSYLSQSSRVVHVGLGDAPRADQVEVHWLGGERQVFGPLPANRRWELVEGRAEPRRLDGGGTSATDGAEAAPTPLTRDQTTEFWRLQRAGMDAVKRHGDHAEAIGLFRRALALNPDHEDSRYYLANSLVATGRPEAALAELESLVRRNPESHRGQRQWAVLRARTATSRAHLEAARAAAERSLAVNREETGSLLLLGELALMLGDFTEADERLALATRTNHRAVGGFFLRAYLAHRRGDEEESARLLESTREARGPDWKPEGTVAEGEVDSLMHSDDTPLAATWRGWDGESGPEAAFTALERRLEGLRRLPEG